MLESSAGGAVDSSFSSTGFSSAGETAVAVNDELAERELAGGRSGFVLLGVLELPLDPEGVRATDPSPPRLFSSAARR